MKKIIINYFASLTAALLFALAVNMNLVPLAVVMACALAACLLWFTDIIRQRSARARRAARAEHRGAEEEYYSIDIPLDDEDQSLAADKPEPVEISSFIRPGSRPSDKYLQMVKEA